MYDYATEKPKLTTPEGIEALLSVREAALDLIEKAGCVRMDKVLDAAVHRQGALDAWLVLACLDYLVERGDLTEIIRGPGTWAQHRIFTRRNQ